MSLLSKVRAKREGSAPTHSVGAALRACYDACATTYGVPATRPMARPPQLVLCPKNGDQLCYTAGDPVVDHFEDLATVIYRIMNRARRDGGWIQVT